MAKNDSPDDRVNITLDGETTAEVSRHQYETVWKERGFKIASDDAVAAQVTEPTTPPETKVPTDKK